MLNIVSLCQISGKEKEYTATVTEVVNGDALMVRTADGTVKKVFLASIRPPREQRSEFTLGLVSATYTVHFPVLSVSKLTPTSYKEMP
jgi:endonuclease YncB( thermonuclease family)